MERSAEGQEGLRTSRRRRGCAARSAADAQAIARRLGIPFCALDFESEFADIVDYFVDEYSRGRTPNPCVACNAQVKFGKLLCYADAVGADFVATGHYARLVRRGEHTLLARSLNRAKDQSYALFAVRRESLKRCLFPLGEIRDKAEVREIAAALGLPVHDRPESQEICFVPNDDYRLLVRRRRPEACRRGEVRDSAGNILGNHQGVAFYTIGQRRGLGIAVGRPVYVTRLDAASNVVTVGPREELRSGGLIASRVNWLVDLSETEMAGRFRSSEGKRRVSVELRAEIKIRYTHTPAAGVLKLLDNGDVEVRFDEPQSAVTPGQAAVFYSHDGIVLGGGWIRQQIPSGAAGAPHG